MELRYQMPSLCWELLFSMSCMHCVDKGSSLKLDLMNISNYVVIIVSFNPTYKLLANEF